MITYATQRIEGLSVFYREAGDPRHPTLVLLGGFPSSSHMFIMAAPLETAFSGDILTGWSGSLFKTPIATKRDSPMPGRDCGTRFGSIVHRKARPLLKHF